MPTRPRWSLLVWCGCLIGLVLRLWTAARLPLDVDELLQVYTALKAGGFREFLALSAGRPTHVLLDPLATWMLSRATDAAFFLRLPSALLGSASIVLLYRVGRRISGPRTGALAAALLALSMTHVMFSSRVDFYAPAVFWTLLSTELFMRAAEDGGSAAFAACMAAQLAFQLTHPYALLIAAAQAAWLAAYRRDRLGRHLACQLPAFICALLWHLRTAKEGAPPTPYGFGSSYSWEPDLFLLRTFIAWAQSSSTLSLIYGGPLSPLELAAAWTYTALAGLGVAGLRRRWTSGWSLAALLLAGVFAAAVVIVRLFSYLFAPPQVLIALPFFLLFVARGLEEAAERCRTLLSPSATLGAGLVSLAALFALSFSGFILDQDAQVRHLDSLVSSAREAGAADALLFLDPNSAQSFLFHFDRDAFLAAPPHRPGPRRFLGEQLFRIPEGLAAGPRHSRVYCILDPWASPEDDRRRWRAMGKELESGGRTFFIYPSKLSLEAHDTLAAFGAVAGLSR